MKKNEFAKLALAIKTYFPRDNVLPSNEALELWYDLLKDLDYTAASNGLKAYVSTNKFAPTISDIRQYATKTVKSEQMNEMQAWEMVSKALRNSSYKSEEEFAKLPPAVQEAVGSPSQLRIWAISDDYNESVVSSNFIKTYRVVINRHSEMERMPDNISALIEEANKNSYTAQIREKYSQATNTMIETKQAVEMDDRHVENDKTVSDRLARFREEMAHD